MQGKWIDVKQELPSERLLVVALLNNGRSLVSSWFCWFPERGDDPMWHNVFTRDGEIVTHWMPLPAPPEPKLSTEEAGL